MTILGIDLGTSQVKALVCAADGTVLGRGTAGYQVRAPREGWAESDPAQWWAAVLRAVRGAGPAVASVAAVGLAGQMHGLVLTSQRGVPIRPAIIWLDRRATAEMADYLRLPVSSLSALGNAPAPGVAGPITLWLSRHEPAAYQSARWLLQPKDWLRFRLTGEPAAEPTDASATLLYDILRDDWALSVVDGLGLRASLLPPLLPGPFALAGALLPGPARELGVPPGIPVAAGSADTAASLLAASLPPDWALLTLGTGGQWIVPVAAPATPAPRHAPHASHSVPIAQSSPLERVDYAIEPAGPLPRTNLFRAVDGWYRLAGAQNVGSTLDWVRGVLNASWDELYAAAAAAGREGLVFDPRLVTERWDETASGGGWTGARLGHSRDDLLRAALTAVAELLRDRLDDLRAAGIAPAGVLVGGGGAQQKAWLDLLADVLGLPLVPAQTPWLSARGATLLAARLLDPAAPPA